MTKEELFIDSLYKLAEKEVKKIYRHKKLNRDVILQEIANVLLTYTISKDVMVMDRAAIEKEHKKMSKLIVSISRGDAISQEKIIEALLSTVVKETFSFYSYNKGLKDVKKIIEGNFKGKHFSERVWDNEKEVAKHLDKKIQDFLKGKVNVNKIRKDIIETFNASSYISERLVETEVSRCSSSAFDRYCQEVNVKKVKYNANLESCKKCKPYNGLIYNFKDKLEVPKHPLCKCFYTVEE